MSGLQASTATNRLYSSDTLRMSNIATESVCLLAKAT